MNPGRATVAAAAAVLLLPASGLAHVGPDPDRNNRYLKITPLGDRIRIAYTVWIGDTPGRAARARLDGNRDGVVSESEAKAYGEEIAAALEEDVATWLDGAPAQIVWEEAIVGLGTPETTAGAFAIDRIGWLCTSGAGEHTLKTVDRVHLPMPGETELRVETGPGITIARSDLPEMGDRLQFSWRGERSPLAEGHELHFEADAAEATFAGHDVCEPPPTTGDAPPKALLIALAVALAVALTGGAVLIARRRS